MLDFFDIYEYLNDRLIDYTESGTNTSRGWVNIRCPFPHCDDNSNHLGINLESKAFHCWKCGEHGTLVQLLQELESCTKRQAMEIVNQFQNIDDVINNSKEKTKTEIRKLSDFKFPPSGATINFPESHLKYLRDRNFNTDVIIPKYKLMACHNIGKYNYRIIIPVIENRIIVNFTSRTIIKDREPRYKMASIEDDKPTVDLSNLLYNFDTVNSRGLILEGPTDVWNIGDGSTCTFGTSLSKAQMFKLAQLDLAVLVFDAEAMEDAMRLQYQIKPFVNTEVVELDSGLDPAQLNDAEVLDLKREFSI